MAQRGSTAGPAVEPYVRWAANVIGPKNERTREVLSWSLFLSLATFIIVLDRAVLFVYLPRWILAIPILLYLFPSRVNSTYWARAAACLALAALPYMLAPVRWNHLKSFYRDCESLEVGMPISDALSSMSAYDPRPPDAMARSVTDGVERVRVQGEGRLLFIPSPDYSSDWCILHLADSRLESVEISPD